MSSNVPTVRQPARIATIPHLIVMGLLILLWYQFEQQYFVILGAASYLLLSFILRTVIPKEHVIGMKKVKKTDFENAIPHFERSYVFFKKHDWLDKYRFLVVLSSSKTTYKEMALNNIAFCYAQMGNGNKAKEYYERTLKEYPESGLAKASLRMLHSIDKNDE